MNSIINLKETKMKRKFILILSVVLCSYAWVNAHAKNYMNMKPVIVEEKNAKELISPEGDSTRTLLTVHNTAGQYTLFTSVFSAKTKVRLHVHRWHDEAFFITRGSFEVVNSDDRVPHVAKTDSAVFTPRGTPHMWRALEDDSKVLVIISPGGHDILFEELGKLTPEQMKDGAFMKPLMESYDAYGVEE